MERKYDIDIKWLSVSSFEIKLGDMTVVTDPYITECACTDLTADAVDNCNIICLSHSHWDHVTDIPRLCDKFKPRILCGDKTAMPLAAWLNYTTALIYPMYPDTELDFGSVKIRALYGRHKMQRGGIGFNDLCAITYTRDVCKADEGIASLQAVGTMEYRNYLFTTPSGTKILIWGNDPTVEQVNICKALEPDIAILQRGTTPQSITETADFAAKIGCKMLIPHHQDLKKPDDPTVIEAFKKEFLSRVPDGTFITPAHGKWIHL